MIKPVKARELVTQQGSINAFARRCEMHPSTLSRILNGRTVPYPKEAEKIAAALNWQGDVSELFDPVAGSGGID